MNIQTFLTQSTKALQAAGIKTARLDCLVLAQHVLQKDKAWLLAHLECDLSPTQQHDLRMLVKKRAQRYPLAYLTGHKEFYGRDFFVTPDVLIPRPETEALVEFTKRLNPTTILDVGTGSGNIAITLALETNAQVIASDVSKKALAIAQKNASNLGSKVVFVESNLLANIKGQFSCIVANLPYVGRSWQRSPETIAEPRLALFADNDGLELINNLIAQAPAHLIPGGHLLLEANPKQHINIQKIAQKHGFILSALEGFALVLDYA